MPEGDSTRKLVIANNVSAKIVGYSGFFRWNLDNKLPKAVSYTHLDVYKRQV